MPADTPVPAHVSVKEAVLPFSRFPGVDTLLGPEMRSTGEVMGTGETFGVAFAKCQLAAGSRLPDEGCVFFSLADKDKPAGVELAGSYAALGFSIAATIGTAGFLRDRGLEVQTLVGKVGLREMARDAVDLLEAGAVQLVVNTPSGRGARHDGALIRAACVAMQVPCLDDAGRRARRGPGRRGPPGARPDGALPPGPARVRARDVDLSTSVGTVALRSCVLTASGTSGHDDELAAYGDLADLGAVVVKSLAAAPWPGNPAPRVAPAGEGMVNAVGLQGPGVAAWRADGLPRLVARGATVVASIWGRTEAEFAAAAEALHGAQVAAVEVNVSCPNLEHDAEMFAHSPKATAAAVTAAARSGLPLWVKLSPTTERVVDVARAAVDAGAVRARAREHAARTRRRRRAPCARARRRKRGAVGAAAAPRRDPLGRGVSCRASRRHRSSASAACAPRDEVVAFVLAGADAVEVGTASLADPRAPWKVQRATRRWCARHGVARLSDMKGQLDG